MKENRNWYPMPRGEKWYLIGLVLYVTLFLLPWSYQIELLNVSLVVWGSILLFFIAPIAGLYLVLTENSERT
ncbi:hypothetical protein [Evansella halocellulosilytica]|uniref:hypothetical protein n=1 Tax=Evansella halocellulosilytica TaxID=2011013 RepID=UPI000BB718A3|nr:hypothetical protein [Evansella halocellulosilytica]